MMGGPGGTGGAGPAGAGAGGPTLSGAALEEAKNRALLFFMDHLMSKSGERTIHDLSCQFGARGFSAEMREAVGGTQEGLQDFLASHPSLFKVDGDAVSINAFGELGGDADAGAGLVANLGVRDRDYVHESIAFFEAKLRKFGPEMLIKSLLGHRSQAAPEVRLVSGRHVKEFTEFLESQPAHFVVSGDRVRMAGLDAGAEERELDDEGRPLAGDKAQATAVAFMRELLENQEAPLPMEALYAAFCDRFAHAVRQDVATNPKELLAFLKAHRHVFFIRSNKVSLVRPKDGDTNDSDSSSHSLPSENVLELTSFISSLRPAQEAVQEVASSVLGPIVGLDVKTVELGPGAGEFASLLVLRAPSQKLLVFDLAHSDSILLESGLKDLLQSPHWLKVMHGAGRVSGLLKAQYGVELEGVFDTQVAHWILQGQKTGQSPDAQPPITFAQMCREYGGESLALSSASSACWSGRPLSASTLRSAVEEARLLFPSTYNLFVSLLDPATQSLFNRLCGLQISPRLHSQPAPSAPVSSPRPQALVAQPPPRPPVALAPPPASQVLTKPTPQPAPPPTNGCSSCNCAASRPSTVSISTQTLSTGDITIQNIYKPS